MPRLISRLWVWIINTLWPPPPPVPVPVPVLLLPAPVSPWAEPLTEALQRAPPPPDVICLPGPPPEPEPKPKRKRKRQPRVQPLRPDLHVADILTMLPACRELMAPMKKIAPEIYKGWTTVGAKAVRLGTEVDVDNTDVETITKHQTSGMIFIHAEKHHSEEDKKQFFPGIFVGYTALGPTPYWTITQPGSLIFEVTIYCADHKGMAWGYPYFVALKNHQFTVPRQRIAEYVDLPRDKQGYKEGFTRTIWEVPRELIKHYHDLRRRNDISPKVVSPDAFGVYVFKLCVAFHHHGHDCHQVRAERDGKSVAFIVGPREASAFFRDRELEDGRKRRIFHYVGEHTRHYATGRTTVVAGHYRGEREFDWYGEHIVITPPERSIQTNFDVVPELQDGPKTPKGWLPWDKVAGEVRDITEAEWRKSRINAGTQI